MSRIGKALGGALITVALLEWIRKGYNSIEHKGRARGLSQAGIRRRQSMYLLRVYVLYAIPITALCLYWPVLPLHERLVNNFESMAFLTHFKWTPLVYLAIVYFFALAMLGRLIPYYIHKANNWTFRGIWNKVRGIFR